MGPIGKLCVVGSLLAGVLVPPAFGQVTSKRKPAPQGVSVYFETPLNGAIVKPMVLVRAGLRGMGVAPADEDISNTGHHHLLIDTDLKDPSEQIPVNNKIIHLNNGETEVAITLKPGPHTLRLVLADANHMQFDPSVMSAKITITVRQPERGSGLRAR